MNADRIEEIKNANDIRDVILDAGIVLKAGRGKCPFCDHALGAFGVKQGFYNCFKCGNAGDVIQFVQKTQAVDFMGAMKILGARVGISTEQSITKIAGDEPKAAAKMYLAERGLEVPEGWYTQETFGYGNKQSATVRFSVGETYWERIVDAHLFTRKANFGGAYKGESWQPTGQRIVKGDRIYITEGIFDAIALMQGLKFKVASAMSSGNFPQKLIDKHKGRGITWCLALDNGAAGAGSVKKWANILKEMGELVEVHYPSDKRDWNDWLKSKKLTPGLIQQAWWRGQKLVAQTAGERMAWIIVEAQANNKFTPNSKIISFSKCYFECSVIKSTDIHKNEDLFAAIEAEDYFSAVRFLTPMISSLRVGTAVAELLYTQYDSVDKSHSYCFNVDVFGVKKSQQVVFSANMTTDAKSFHLALWNQVGQAGFSGNAGHMAEIIDGWLSKRKPTVETIRHMGYSPKHKAYVFENFGYKDGHMTKVNKYNYLNIGNMALKTSFVGWTIPELDKKTVWFDDFYIMGGNNGLTCLAFWMMSAFAQQVRVCEKTIPFLEFTGPASTGKSTIIEFLWLLFGRDDYEGEDPEKLTQSAFGRVFMQASNCPVVLLEGDRNETHHRKKFSIEHLKTLFRGQSPYGRGVRNNGLDIDNVPFLGTLAISQNAQIEGEEQILSRFVHCTSSKKDFTNESYLAANRIKALKSDNCIDFFHNILSNEKQIMATYSEWYIKYRDHLLGDERVGHVRISENHAQIMAFGKCLQLILPELDDGRLKLWIKFMVDGAIKRQLACDCDSVLINEFWEIYETFNTKIGENDSDSIVRTEVFNHSRDPDFIAINLRRFKKIAEENRQSIDIVALRKQLTNSKRYKFVKQAKVDSAILGGTTHCWIFKKG